MRRSPSPFAIAALSLLCVLLMAACNSSTMPVLRYITISPASATGTVGSQVTFAAQLYFSDGSIQNGTTLVVWTSSNTAVASMNANVATPLTAGTTTIMASVTNAQGKVSATATLTVNTLATLTITPMNPSVPVGAQQQFDAMAKFSDGTTQDVTTLANWFSSNSDVTIGLNTGLATVATTATVNETSTISAFLYGASQTTLLTVSAPIPVSLTVTPVQPANATIAIGNIATFTATENWSDGSTGHVPSGTVAWTSSSTAQAGVIANATVSSNATAAGFASSGTTPVTITATEGTLTAGTAPLTVVTGSAHYAYVSTGPTSAPPVGPAIDSFTVTPSAAPYLTTPQSTDASFMPGNPFQTVFHPNGQFVYVTDGTPNVWVLTVDPSTGALARPSTTPAPIGSYGPISVGGSANDFTFVAVDPYGRFLYVSDDGFGGGPSSISAFAINSDGSLTQLASIPPGTKNTFSPEHLIIDHTGSYLYATNYYASVVNAYNINPDGTLTPFSSTPPSSPTFSTGANSNPWHAALDPTGTYLYAADAFNNAIVGFTIGSGGVLSPLSGSPFPVVSGVTAAVFVSAVVVHPSGQYIYALDDGGATGQVFAFSLGSNGMIGSAIGTPVATGNGPQNGFVVDPTGALLAAENSGDGTISLYTIAPSTSTTPPPGGLTAAAPINLGTGALPFYVTFYNAP